MEIKNCVPLLRKEFLFENERNCLSIVENLSGDTVLGIFKTKQILKNRICDL